MAKKILVLMISCLMVLSLVIASCDTKETSGGTVTEVDKGQTVVVGGEDEEKTDVGTSGPSTTVTADPDKPRYGGTLVVLTGSDITVWNPGAVIGQSADGIGGWVLEQILGIDFAKGPAGTGETSYIGGVEDYRYVGPNLAESFETPGVGVWVLNIRQGVRWAYNPEQAASKLVNGREMTAEDVAYSLEYMRDNKTMSALFEPGLMQNMVVERTGPWQLTVRTPVAPTTGYLWLMGGGGVQYVWPKEFLDTYGKSNNWYDVVGNGPFMIDDYVPSVALNLIKNDNYWDINPVGPGKGDKLPYIDGIKYQIIPDYSTRLAALRTGKADFSAIDTLEQEDFDTIIRTNPNIKYAQTIIAPQQVAGDVRKTDSPFSKKEVRQAMMLAINHPEIVEDFYKGQAEYLDSPARKWYKSIYTPLEEQNSTVQELYGYNPEKAKQLLADAGYPNGFKIKMEMSNTPASEQAFSIISEYWSQVGIEVEAVLHEPTVFTNVWIGRTYEDLILSSLPGGDGSLFVRYSMGYFRGPNAFNLSCVNDPVGTDPVIEHAYEVQCENVMVNYPAADAITKETWKYVLEQAFLIQMPAPWGYRIWQPWLRNYYGAGATKFWLRWAWIDQDMRADMTGRR